MVLSQFEKDVCLKIWTRKGGGPSHEGIHISTQFLYIFYSSLQYILAMGDCKIRRGVYVW